MSEHSFKCEVIRYNRMGRSVFYVVACASMGIGMLVYLFLQVGLENLAELFRFVMSAATAVFLLVLAYAKGSELWELRNHKFPSNAELVITDEALEHRFGLTKFVIPLQSIAKVQTPTKSGEGVGLTLKDGSELTLPVPLKEREFMAHLKESAVHAT